jgi:hypothetical protein
LTDVLGSFVAGRTSSLDARLECGLISLVTAATPITLVSFTAEALDGRVVLTWRISDDSDPAGFQVYRARSEEGPYERLTDRPLPAPAREFTDFNPPPGVTLWYRLSGVDREGEEFHFGAVSSSPEAPPGRLALSGSYPNPSRGATRFALDLPQSGEVRLQIFDPAGRRVAVVFDGPLAAGRHTMIWDGRLSGGRVAAGVYFGRLDALGRVETRRLVVAP